MCRSSPPKPRRKTIPLAKKKTDTAEALLDAHVQFLLRQLEGKSLRARIEREVDAVLGDAERVSL